MSAGDSDRYSAHLAADAIHNFPGTGIVEREEVLAGVADAAVIQLRSATVWTEAAEAGAQTVDRAVAHQSAAAT